ncbi:hypothetical protein OIU85_000814 [Salix viminalis]|uniref:Uncharacterized protein n=1 Tax=Salix viminalis TaxID=40686 RepID=A0A9Q0VK84_SALVM|nr:hypothetical protein OIU85_000814 [Salix viminalis]
MSTSLSIPTHFFFYKTFSSQNPLFIPKPLSLALPRKATIIRMGGGPRTYPGGVSKWQWKRMQKNKAKQLLKARLSRERQIYEMRRRAELKASVSELERPWEVVQKASKLFSVGADEQVKVLADRFQKPGGFELWSERDGSQLFETPDGVPSARFFPKDVVHSVKPYGKVSAYGFGELSVEMPDSELESETESETEAESEYENDGMSLNGELSRDDEDGSVLKRAYWENPDGKLRMDKRNAKSISCKTRKKGNRRRFGSAFTSCGSGLVGFETRVGGTSKCDSGGNNRSKNGSRISKTRGLRNR